jgi:spore maturation protein CgeB
MRVVEAGGAALWKVEAQMRIVVFGLTVSSSWGNGHATLWRGMIGALARQGHAVVFFERDVPYYRDTRDLKRLGDGDELVLYGDWSAVSPRAAAEVAGADVVIVTSFCPDGPVASDLAFRTASGLTAFYDMDTPVTLAQLARGGGVDYLPPQGLGDFDLVLSYTGGAALELLRSRLGARRVAPLYGHVDPRAHSPGTPQDAFRGDLSYLGTYAEDRQPTLERLLVEPARLRPDFRFVIAGTGYPDAFPWSDNIYFVRHLPPPDHPAFFASSRLTLNVTRDAMATMGWCPSGRLFEAAACGVPVLSDRWPGLEEFFTPGKEILTVERSEDVIAALELPDGELAAIARAARARVFAEHSSDVRAAQLVELCGTAPERKAHVACGE